MFKRSRPIGDPYGIRIRPSSAGSRLYPSESVEILSSLRPATSAAPRVSSPDEGLPYEQVDEVNQDRRLTLAEVDGIALKADLLTRLNTPSSSIRRIKIEERITLDQLHRIKTAFEEADTDGSGSLDIEEFKGVVKKTLGVRGKNEEQIIALFMKIDSSSDGEIDWDEFCTYMQLEYAEKEEAVLRSKRVNFVLPAPSELTPHHKAPVLNILQVSDSLFMCTSQEGLFSFWTPDLQLKKTRNIGNGYLSTSHLLKPSTWVTDVCMIGSHNKIVVATGDREIHFYELSTFEFYCQITGLSTTPLRLEIEQNDNDHCLIMYGDDQGCVSILSLNSLSRTLRLWKKAPRVNNVPSVALQDVVTGDNVSFVKWKVHDDWVTNVRYYHELRYIASSSNNTNTALVLGCVTASTTVDEMREITKAISGQAKLDNRMFKKNNLNAQKRQKADQSIFKVYKGVKTFDFSKERNILATGGVDRILRLWNPYMPQKPTARLTGHNAPLLHLFIAGNDDRIFSISNDNVMKVWDLVDHVCLVTLNPKLHKIRGEILGCMYSDNCKAVAIVTDHISMLKIKKNEIDLGSGIMGQKFKQAKISEEMPVSHTEPVTCCGFNTSFNHVVTCSDSGVVKLWDFETGRPMFEFDKTHGEGGITCMTFDHSGRRLITGGRDGALRIWNYNNGHCLKTLQQENNIAEVTGCAYIELNKNNFILSVGWNRRISIYNDNPQDFRHFQRPAPYWPDDLMNGHTEDVIAMAFGAPSLIATVSYDGLVIVWNIVSGHSVCHLRNVNKGEDQSEVKTDDEDSGHETNTDQDRAVNEVLFITSRVQEKTEAQLIAGCADGTLLFYCVHEGELYAKCNVTSESCGVGAMCLAEDNRTLYVADQRGYVRLWNIANYARKPPCVYRRPELILGWRAHIQGILCMRLIEQHDIVLTGSADHTLRMWSTESEYIGTFGQSSAWDVHDKSTWKHPMVPPEVLFDPKSMPDHPVIQQKLTMDDVIHEDSLQASEDEEEEEEVLKKDVNRTPRVMIHSPPRSRRKSSRVDDWRAQLSRRLSRSALVTNTTDEDMQMLDEIRKSMASGSGKRLRHEKLVSKQRQLQMHHDAGAHAFQSLKCFDLVNASDKAAEARKPNPRKYINDPFISLTEDIEEEN